MSKMKMLTREQRVAVKKIYDRDTLLNEDGSKMSYRQFRKTVGHGWECAMVKWKGMWLGIQTDGYTHS